MIPVVIGMMTIFMDAIAVGVEDDIVVVVVVVVVVVAVTTDTLVVAEIGTGRMQCGYITAFR